MPLTRYPDILDEQVVMVVVSNGEQGGAVMVALGKYKEISMPNIVKEN